MNIDGNATSDVAFCKHGIMVDLYDVYMYILLERLLESTSIVPITFTGNGFCF